MSQESDGNRRVFTAPPWLVTAHLWSSTWRLTALPPSAHYVLRVITWRSLRAQCADCIRAQYILWGSDIQKDPERSPCKLSRFIILRLYCHYLSYLSATTEFNWRCLRPYPATTATPFRLYCVFIITPSHGANCVHAQSNHRRMAILAPLPRPVKMHTAAVLCRCWRFYRAHFCVLHFLGMQQDRPMNAALVWRGFKQSLEVRNHLVLSVCPSTHYHFLISFY